MSLNKPNVPAVADYNTVANQQTAANTTAGTESQQGSLINQFNPYGSQTYTQTGTGANGIPIYSSNISLSPQQQQLFNTLQSTQQAAGTAGNNLLTGANYGGTDPTTAIGDMASGRVNQRLQAYQASIQPTLDTQTSQLDAQMRNQGLAPGNPAYDNAMRTLRTNQAQNTQGFLASAEPQAYNEAQSLYQMPLSMAQQLASMGAPTQPNADFTQNPGLNIQPANITGAAANQSQAQMAAYNAQNQAYQSTLSGLFGIPTAVLGGWAKGGFTGAGTAANSLGSLFG